MRTEQIHALVFRSGRIDLVPVTIDGHTLREKAGRSYVLDGAPRYGYGKKDVYVVDGDTARAVAVHGTAYRDGETVVTPEYLDALVEAGDLYELARAASEGSWLSHIPWIGLGAGVGALVCAGILSWRHKKIEEGLIDAIKGLRAPGADAAAASGAAVTQAAMIVFGGWWA